MKRPIVLPRGWRLVAWNAIDSTNEAAMRLVTHGYSPGLVVVADSQSAGRGRRGARWVSDPGNLHMTIVVEAGDGQAPGELAYVAGLSVADAIANAAAISTSLKWPNDILRDGRKLGGILIEETGRPGVFAVGIGLNIAYAPRDTAMPAGALSGYGASATRDALLEAVCDRCAARLAAWRKEGFSAIRADWRARAYGIGLPVTARLADGSVERGIFDDIDGTGALMLQRADGTVRPISAGAVFFEGAS